MQSLGFEAKNSTVYSMIRDITGDDQIDFDRFLEMMSSKIGDTDSREDINKVFALFDAEGKGRISLRDLKRVAKELGETMTDAELLEMVERADRDGDSEITQEDFYLVSSSMTCSFLLPCWCTAERAGARAYTNTLHVTPHTTPIYTPTSYPGYDKKGGG